MAYQHCTQSSSSLDDSGDARHTSRKHSSSHRRRSNNSQNSSSLRQNNDSPGSNSTGSFSSASSSSTDLCSPPRAFPKRAEIQTNQPKKTYQIRYKSRWEPMTKEEEKNRLRALKKAKKRERKDEKRRKKCKRKGKKRQAMVEEFHRGKDHFRPLTHFLKNRKRMADELLDSIDLETRYEIFPEIEDKSDIEVHEIVYGFLKGMSRKRILAIMQGTNFSESSSTETDAINDEEFEGEWNEEDENEDMEEAENELEKEPENANLDEDDDEEEEKRQRESLLRKMRLKRKQKEMEAKKIMRKEEKSTNGEEELEEGEIRSEESNDAMEEVSGSKSGGQNYQMDKDKEEFKSSSNGASELQKISPTLTKLEDANLQKVKMEPKFIISLNYSHSLPPGTSSAFINNGNGLSSDEDGEECDQKEFEQRIVCILPPSPIQLSPSQNAGEEDEGIKIQQENSNSEKKGEKEEKRNGEFADGELIVGIENRRQQQRSPIDEGEVEESDCQDETANDLIMVGDGDENNGDEELKVTIEDYEEPDIEIVED